MWSAVLIREARLRAGLTQQELADRSGRERVRDCALGAGRCRAEPRERCSRSIQACGFDLPLELAARDDSANERLQKNARLSPERRVQRLLQARSKSG